MRRGTNIHAKRHTAYVPVGVLKEVDAAVRMQLMGMGTKDSKHQHHLYTIRKAIKKPGLVTMTAKQIQNALACMKIHGSDKFAIETFIVVFSKALT